MFSSVAPHPRKTGGYSKQTISKQKRTLLHTQGLGVGCPSFYTCLLAIVLSMGLEHWTFEVKLFFFTSKTVNAEIEKT